MNKRKHSWRIPPEQVEQYHRENGSAPNLSEEERTALSQGRSDVQKQRWAKPGQKEALSQRNAAQWADPEYRAAQTERLRANGKRLAPIIAELWKDPEYRARVSATHKALWTPEKRAAQSEISKKALGNEETKAKLSAAATKNWQDPEFRAKTLAARAAVASTPEFKARHKASVSTPENRAKAAEGARQQWASYSEEEKAAKMGRLHSTVKGGHHMSALEAQVVMVLNRLGAWYKLHALTGKYVADILVQGTPMIDIECDGDYWHQDKTSDVERDNWFTANGYNVIRLRDADIPNMTEILTSKLT